MRVDYVAMSHPDLDHFGGLDFVVRNFAPREFWMTPLAGSVDASFVELLADLVRAEIPIVQIDGHAPYSSIAGVAIELLRAAAKEDPTRAKRSRRSMTRNNGSMVLRLSFGATSVLFCGDIEAPAERALLESSAPLRSTVLKVPHHGSGTSSTPAFVAAVNPSAAVISDGYLNRFHFPAVKVLDRYSAAGVSLYRTDLSGAVMLDAARDTATIRTWREPLPERLRVAGPSPHK
jgi:competence protein ComEC